MKDVSEREVVYLMVDGKLLLTVLFLGKVDCYSMQFLDKEHKNLCAEMESIKQKIIEQ